MIIILLFIALLLLVIFGLYREQFDRYRKSSKGVRNHDHQLREFLYRTDLSADEVRGRLLREFRLPHTQYRFDPETSRITFYSDIPNGSKPVTFTVHLTGQGSGTAIRVVQVDHLYENKLYPLMQNEFWHQLAEAEPVPYSDQ